MGVLRFGPNGWRARVDDGFDEPNVVRLAYALGKVWAARHVGGIVLVGYDTRRNARRLALAAGQVLASTGLEVVVSDRVCPTPALGWWVAHTPACVGGVMLTAGRMPCEYGGVLVRQADGGPLGPLVSEEVDRAIEPAPVTARGTVGSVDPVTPYLEELAHEADTGLIRSAGLRVVLDPMYGACSGYATQLLERVGCTVVPIHDEPVPDFRGLHPTAAEPWVDACERTVRDDEARMGLVLNGDGTRIGVIDEDGRLVSPHDLAPLVLEHIVRQRGRQGRVVATAASSVRIARQAERLGCDFTMVPVGFDALYREMGEGDVILASDESGAICVPSHLPERDGLLAAVMLLELLAGADEGVRALVRACEDEMGVLEYAARDIRLDFGQTQRLRNLLPGFNPRKIAGLEPVLVSHAGGLRVTLEDGSWLLVRPHTSSAGARAVCEAPTTEQCAKLLEYAGEVVHM